MYNNASQVRILQLDHTSRCNLHCPLCARTSVGMPKNLNPRMPIADLTIDDYKILLEPFEYKNLKQIFHCGNFGDVITSPTFEETLYYQLNFTHLVRISTNGSARKPKWWEDLVKKCGDKLDVIFAIDGLEDTNHLYRVGSNWNKIIENAKAFINAGGKAYWNFIEFDHNSHQIDQAKELAYKLGFKSFVVKSSRRTSSLGKPITSDNVKQQMAFTNNKMKLNMTAGAKGLKGGNQNYSEIKTIEKKFNTFDEYVEKTDVSCIFKNERKIFVDMEMKLWPCCWFGAIPYLQDKQTKSFENVYKLYGKDFNDMRINGWNVLNHEFFTTYLPVSWSRRSRGKYKRIYTCGKTCGTLFNCAGASTTNTIVTTFGN